MMLSVNLENSMLVVSEDKKTMAEPKIRSLQETTEHRRALAKVSAKNSIPKAVAASVAARKAKAALAPPAPPKGRMAGVRRVKSQGIPQGRLDRHPFVKEEGQYTLVGNAIRQYMTEYAFRRPRTQW